MHRWTAIVALALGCGPDAPADSATDSTSGTGGTPTTAEPVPTATTDEPATTGAGTTAADGTSTAGEDGLAQHGPCPRGDECALCVQSEGASICGPECFEYGPGWAPMRCPDSAVQQQTICPLENDVPGVCLILCDTTADCPDPGMVCVTCPEPYQGACYGLQFFGAAGSNLCAWPAM